MGVLAGFYLRLGCPKMPENNDVDKQEDGKRETEKAC